LQVFYIGGLANAIEELSAYGQEQIEFTPDKTQERQVSEGGL